MNLFTLKLDLEIDAVAYAIAWLWRFRETVTSMHRMSAAQAAEYVTKANADLRAGCWSRADALCQLVLDHAEVQHAGAYNGLGAIAWNLGLLLKAEHFFRQAVQLQPDNRAYVQNLAAASAQLAKNEKPASTSPQKFLLIKAWGMGFFSDVDHVLGGLLLSEITGRTPVVHWGPESLFSEDPRQDAWREFFEPVSDVSFADLQRANHACFPPKWGGGRLGEKEINKWRGEFSALAPCLFLNRPEPLVVCDFFIQLIALPRWIDGDHPLYGWSAPRLYRYLVDKYLRPAKAVKEAIDSFYSCHLAGKRFVAIHLRGSDKRVELPRLDEVNQRCLAMLDHWAAASDPAVSIFALTDSQPIADDLVRRHGARIVLTPSARSQSDKGVHYTMGRGEKIQRGREVLIDAYLAARAEKFVGNGWSSVAGMIEHLKDWAPRSFHLTAPNAHYLRNFHIYEKSG